MPTAALGSTQVNRGGGVPALKELVAIRGGCQGCCFRVHLTDEETEAQRSYLTCPRLHGCHGAGSRETEAQRGPKPSLMLSSTGSRFSGPLEREFVVSGPTGLTDDRALTAVIGSRSVICRNRPNMTTAEHPPSSGTSKLKSLWDSTGHSPEASLPVLPVAQMPRHAAPGPPCATRPGQRVPRARSPNAPALPTLQTQSLEVPVCMRKPLPLAKVQSSTDPFTPPHPHPPAPRWDIYSQLGALCRG